MPTKEVLPDGAADGAFDKTTSKASASSLLQTLTEAQLAATVHLPHETARPRYAQASRGRPVNRQELMDGWCKTDALRQQMLSEIDVLGPLRPRDLRTGCKRARSTSQPLSCQLRAAPRRCKLS